MTTFLRRATRPLGEYIGARVVRWRTGSTEGQIAVLLFLFILIDIITVISIINYNSMPITVYIIPMLLASLALRYRPLILLLGFTVICVGITVTNQGLAPGRVSGLVALAIAALILLLESRMHRSGLPGPLGEAMLVDLRDRLQSQGVVPPLPKGWKAQSSMLTAGGLQFAGDFLVADLTHDEKHLEMILVDVCGKGVAAGTQSLQFAGALGGLIGSLPPQALFAAANSFLLRQRWDDGFATAVHVLVNLEDGRFSIISAGHPPALRWDSGQSSWEIDGARGMALGIQERPDFRHTEGTLGSGDALMFYTDGVVESHSQDFTAGIEWLRTTAKTIVTSGFDGAPRRILNRVADGDDDRAVLILRRD